MVLECFLKASLKAPLEAILDEGALTGIAISSMLAYMRLPMHPLPPHKCTHAPMSPATHPRTMHRAPTQNMRSLMHPCRTNQDNPIVLGCITEAVDQGDHQSFIPPVSHIEATWNQSSPFIPRGDSWEAGEVTACHVCALIKSCGCQVVCSCSCTRTLCCVYVRQRTKLLSLTSAIMCQPFTLLSPSMPIALTPSPPPPLSHSQPHTPTRHALRPHSISVSLKPQALAFYSRLTLPLTPMPTSYPSHTRLTLTCKPFLFLCPRHPPPISLPPQLYAEDKVRASTDRSSRPSSTGRFYKGYCYPDK